MADQSSSAGVSEKYYNIAIKYIGRLACFLSSGVGLVSLLYYDGITWPVDLLQKSGTVTAICFLVFSGFMLFNMYNKAFGEFVLYPIQHGIHCGIIDFIGGNYGDEQTSPIYLLRHYGVMPARARLAYKRVRLHLYQDDEQFFNQMAHTEVHLFYIALFLSVAQGSLLFLCYHNSRGGRNMMVFSFLLYLYILFIDTRLHQGEAADIRDQKDKVVSFLKTRDLIPRGDSVIPNAHSDVTGDTI